MTSDRERKSLTTKKTQVNFLDDRTVLVWYYSGRYVILRIC